MLVFGEEWIRENAYVTLANLKAADFNGRTGTVIEIRPDGRVGVSLAVSGEWKAIRPGNLVPFVFERHAEVCPKCSDRINLSAFPPCSCDSDCNEEQKLDWLEDVCKNSTQALNFH